MVDTENNLDKTENFNHNEGFGFDQDMDDIFSDSRIRSRLPRMRDPFGTFGTHGDDDFFSGFGRRRNPHEFFDFPDEFRQYIPEGFGIPRSGSGGSGRTHQVHPTYQQYHQADEHSAGPHSQYAPPRSPHYDNIPQSPKPNLCDASIQTDADLTDGVAENQQQTKSSSGPKLNNRYSHENEENRGPRSQSAPPHQNEEIQQPPPSEEPVYVSSATFSTSAPQHGKYVKNKPQGGNGIPPQPPQRQQQAFYLNNPNQGQARQWPPPTQTQSPQKTFTPEPQTPGGTIIRTIPIFVEGRKDPIINEHKEIPGQTTPSQQQQAPQFFQPQQQQHTSPKPPVYQKPPTYSSPSKTSLSAQMPEQQIPSHHPEPQYQQTYLNQPKSHPTVDTHQQIPESCGMPPQTPHTMDCINRIQNIQRDVLHLMEQVEAFKGIKNDKEYMYLDEMLTRNLLKLDTIDTNGKDSIRLARKEAIKCIQASINVLEAKAEENARKTGIFAVRHNSIEEEPVAEEKEQATSSLIEENPNILNEQTVIPLPPPPEHKDNDRDIKKSNSLETKQRPIAVPEKSLSGSETKSSKETKENNQTNPSESGILRKSSEKEIKTEKAPSKSKVNKKEGSPTNDADDSDRSREKSRSQSKSPSKSPTKLGAKEGAKKKIIKKIKKLTQKGDKDSKENQSKTQEPDESEKQVTEANQQNTEESQTNQIEEKQPKSEAGEIKE